jgi:transcription initiation factor TFIID subunit 2
VPTPATETATPINEKKCKAILNNLNKMPESAIFSVPVDPIRDGCPTYYDEIKNPMDLGTMYTKLSNSRYATMEDFARDARLVFKNCRQFNPPGTYPVICADKIEQAFDKEWAKAMEKKLSWQEKRSLIAIVNKLVADPISWVFREPVDPVILGIPTYFEIIPKKDARDLRTIKRKLDEDKYDSLDAFRADFELMIRNAITFNGAESEVGQMALTLLARFKDSLASSSALAASLNASAGASGLKKRKEGDRGTPQPMPKKLKLV